MFNKLHILITAFLIVTSTQALSKGPVDNPPPIEVDVFVTNDETQPVPVTGAVDARINNSPGTESFWASGRHQEADTGGTRKAIDFDLKFTIPGSSGSLDNVPNDKIVVVEYVSCQVTQMGGTFSLSEMFSFFASTGIVIKAKHELPWVETGGSFVRAHFNGPVRLYASSGNFLSVQAGVSGPSTTNCEATGYLLDAP